MLQRPPLFARQKGVPAINVKSSVVFAPAVGTHYGNKSAFGIPVLIVGESHYADWDAPKNLSEWTTAALKQGCARFNGESMFWRSIPRTVAGVESITPETLTAFWAEVALYNYFQHVVTHEAPATVVVGRAYRPAFLEMLAALQPKLMLVFSVKSWWAMPPSAAKAPALQNTVELPTEVYNIGPRHQALAVKLKHPRSGLSPSEWHPKVKQALRAAKKLPYPVFGISAYVIAQVKPQLRFS